MSPTQAAMAVGAVFGVVWVTVDFWPAVLVLVLIGIGAVIGRIVEGKLDVSSMVQAVSGRGSSS